MRMIGRSGHPGYSKTVRYAGLAMAGLVGLVGVVLLVWLVPPALYKHVHNEQARVSAEASTRTGLIAGLAGLAALGGLAITARTYRLSEQGHITDRYTKAIEQLGADKLNVRLGGVYALERIAVDSKRDHPTVVEVLSAYVREVTRRQRAQRPEQEAQSAANRAAQETDAQARPRVDVLGALSVLSRLPARPFVSRGDLTGALVAGAQLDQANLSGAQLRGVDLSGAELQDANLTNADLYDANLTGAQLDQANLSGAQLAGADLSGAWLNNADLSRAWLARANLFDAMLGGSDLSGADFGEADLSGAWLNNADLSGAWLHGADLSGAHDLTQRQLDAANGDAKTRLPSGLQRPPNWSTEEL